MRTVPMRAMSTAQALVAAAIFAACSSGSAPAVDAAAGGEQIVSADGEATVSVYYEGVPVEGAWVFSFTPQHALLAERRLDGSGLTKRADQALAVGLESDLARPGFSADRRSRAAGIHVLPGIAPS